MKLNAYWRRDIENEHGAVLEFRAENGRRMQFLVMNPAALLTSFIRGIYRRAAEHELSKEGGVAG